MEYLIHILIMICIYTILAFSLNIVAGFAGLLSIAQAFFYGLGAYAAALMSIHIGTSFWLNIVLSVVICASIGGIIGIIVLSLRDDSFVLATFAVQIIGINIFSNWVSVTGGPSGIPGIPPLQFFGWVDSNKLLILLAVVILGSVAAFLHYNIERSGFGLVLKGIREDEVWVESRGKPVKRFKVIAFMVSCAFAGASGAVYAHYFRYVDPSAFHFMESVLIISMVVIGGAGSRWGPVLGAIILVTLPELLRVIGLPGPTAANLRQIIYGVLLVAMMMFRPKGLLGKYGFSK